MRSSTTACRQKLGPMAVTCVGLLFLVTTLTLYHTISSMDDKNSNSRAGGTRSITTTTTREIIALRQQQQQVDNTVDHSNNNDRRRRDSEPSNDKKHRKKHRHHGNAAPDDPLVKSSRQVFESEYDPNDFERTQRVVDSLRVTAPKSHYNTTTNGATYNVNDCPSVPPEGYPFHWPLLELLQDWNPDDTNIPDTIYQSMCIFDYNVDYEKAETYRQAELPFILTNTPEILKTVERWSTPDYISRMIGADTKLRNEFSHDNHLMFWRTVGLRKSEIPQDWKPPTITNISLSYDEWLEKALVVDRSPHPEKEEHYYFRLNGEMHNNMNTYVYEELPVFRSQRKPSMFIVDPDQTRGINCRFGMKGAIAEAHFDWSRNWIIVLGGQRRYILGHPRQCQNLNLYKLGHPWARHAQDDWSAPFDSSVRENLQQAQMHEVVLQPGDALYLPTAWFHFIVSLNIDYQCNARSGTTTENSKYIHEDCNLDGKVVE